MSIGSSSLIWKSKMLQSLKLCPPWCPQWDVLYLTWSVWLQSKYMCSKNACATKLPLGYVNKAYMKHKWILFLHLDPIIMVSYYIFIYAYIAKSEKQLWRTFQCWAYQIRGTQLVLHFFLWLNSIPLDRYSCCLFIHSLIDGHLGCFHFLAFMNNAAVNIL